KHSCSQAPWPGAPGSHPVMQASQCAHAASPRHCASSLLHPFVTHASHTVRATAPSPLLAASGRAPASARCPEPVVYESTPRTCAQATNPSASNALPTIDRMRSGATESGYQFFPPTASPADDRVGATGEVPRSRIASGAHVTRKMTMDTTALV